MRARYVSFSLGQGRYCIPVDQVIQIIRLENLIEIPKPPPYVEGVLNIRGDIIPVVSLRTRLELGAGEHPVHAAADQRKRRVIITRLGTRSYGLDVDEVREIVDIEEGGISGDATTLLGVRADFILGIAQREESVYIVLDLPRVLGLQRDLPGSRTGLG
jgi:purine-binding chemotaxis protein CheW